MTRPSKSKALDRLKSARNEIPKLQSFPRFSSEFKKWRRNTEVAIENTFGEAGRHVEDFTNISYTLSIYHSKTPEYRFQQRYVEGLESAGSILESMIEEIEEYWEDEDEMKVSASPLRDDHIDTKRVFVVHGRDDGTKHTVARFLERKDLIPVILNEQPDEGLTIIEKFEKHAQNVGFAVILLTPDDVGALRGDQENLRPRARQNVILELGYFIHSLGRDRVCALVKGDVERPSDYHGVIYIPLDEHEGWQKQLVKNLEAAGLDVDANRAV